MGSVFESNEDSGDQDGRCHCPQDDDCEVRGLVLYWLALGGLQVVGIALLAVVAVPEGEALEAMGRTQGAGDLSIVVVAHHRFAAVVAGVEHPELGGVAGEALAVDVAGEAVIGAVGASGPGLAVVHQLGEALLHALILPADVVAVGALGAVSQRQTRRALPHTGLTHRHPCLEVPLHRDAPRGGCVHLPMANCHVAGGAGEITGTALAVVGTRLTQTGGVVGVGAKGTVECRYALADGSEEEERRAGGAGGECEAEGAVGGTSEASQSGGVVVEAREAAAVAEVVASEVEAGTAGRAVGG
jgi:hypothetical protein